VNEGGVVTSLAFAHDENNTHMRAAIMTSGPIVASFTVRCCAPIVVPGYASFCCLEYPSEYPYECPYGTP
jgi:hypothetical protein